MSLGGCYVAIKQEQLDDIIDKGHSLSEVVFDDNSTLRTYSLEQAWDAIRILLMDVAPAAIGSNELEGVDLGETCLYLTPSEVNEVNKQISSLTKETIIELFNSAQFQEAEFYWDNLWKEEDNLEELIDFILGLKEFLQKSAQEKETVLFYLT